MHRIFFDANDGTMELGYDLSLPKSLEDIELIRERIFDGLQVIIYMPFELEMEAVLRFDKSIGHWVAMPIKETIKYLDPE